MALGQNPDLTFPNKINVVVREIIDLEKKLLWHSSMGSYIHTIGT